MSPPYLQVGIDFSQQRADFCLLAGDGQVIDRHQGFTNSYPGYLQAKAYLLTALGQSSFDGIHIAAEATNYFWLPYFLQLYDDVELQAHGLRLFLVNPKQVHWFKRSFSPDNKSDQDDPYYIAEHSRTRPNAYTWTPQKPWLALRFYTRLRFHLGQALTREKNFCLSYLFLQHSAYPTVKPFSNPFGQTSSAIVSNRQLLKELSQLPIDDLVTRLQTLSHNRLPNPQRNAERLCQVTRQSFPVEESLAVPVQHVLDLTLATIRFLERQCRQVEAIIAGEVEHHHPEALYLASLPGLGMYFAAGITAEIGDLGRYFQGAKWDRPKKRYRPKTLKDVEDAVAKSAGLWWPRNSSGDFEAQERHLSKQGSRYLRYYLVEGADRLRQYVPDYAKYYQKKYAEVSKHKHKRALVLTARKSLALYVGLLHRNEPYRSKEVRKS